MSALIDPKLSSPEECSTNANTETSWLDVCSFSDLIKDSGVCALLTLPEKAQQIAIFYMSSKDTIYAVSNWDPIGKANVIYRGILCSINDSTMYSEPII